MDTVDVVFFVIGIIVMILAMIIFAKKALIKDGNGEKPIPEKNTSNFLLAKLVRGELGLANTYWLFGGLLGIATYILYYSPDILSARSEDPTVAIIFYGIMIFIFNIITVVGVWRSANKYQGKQTWAMLARLFTLISAIGIIVIIISTIIYSMDSFY